MDVVHTGRVDVNPILFLDVLRQTKLVVRLNARNRLKEPWIGVVFLKFFEEIEIADPFFADFLKRISWNGPKLVKPS